MKYSYIRDWVINHIEHCSKEEIVELYEILSKIRKLSELTNTEILYGSELAVQGISVEWDE